MTTARQIEANRRNAERSTGPRTPEGKAISRLNARTHGLTGEGVALSGADAARVEERLPGFLETFGPINESETCLVRDLVLMTVRIENCYQYESVIIDSQARSAETSWDLDREFEAAKLVDRIGRKPEIISRELTRTKQGCLIAIGQWRALASAIEERGEWTDPERSRALDLLGVPRALRDAPTILDDLKATGAADRKAHLLSVAQSQIAILTDRVEGCLDMMDQHDRRLAGARLVPFLSPEWKTIERYERACRRRFEWNWNRLMSRSSRSRPAGDHPVATPASIPSSSRDEPEFAPAENDPFLERLALLTSLVTIGPSDEDTDPSGIVYDLSLPENAHLCDPANVDWASLTEDEAIALAKAQHEKSLADAQAEVARRAQLARERARLGAPADVHRSASPAPAPAPASRVRESSVYGPTALKIGNRRERRAEAARQRRAMN